MVLACLVRDADFFSKAGKILGKDPKTGFVSMDFATDIDNALMQVIDLHYQCMGARPPLLTLNFTQVAANSIASDARGVIGPDEVEGVVFRLNQILALRVEECKPIVVEGFGYWLGKRRVAKVIREQTSMTNWNPAEMLQSISTQVSAVGLANSVPTFFEFGNALDNRILETARIPIPGLSGLTKSLGGGLAKKEGTLFIAPQGSGKTVLACQLGSSLSASSGQIGIIITTEQGHEELEPRVIANKCGIPFNLIKDGFDERALREDMRERYHRFREQIKGKLFWENWNRNDRAKTIRNDLKDVIHRRQDELGKKVDYVILDWIGGALGKMSEGDADRLRFTYQLTGETICDIAREEDMYTVAFSQANMALAINKPRVDATMIKECKSLGEPFTNVIGMTALWDQTPQEGDDNIIWAPRQFFYVDKARKSQGGRTPFLRQFDYQRIGDILNRPEPM